MMKSSRTNQRNIELIRKIRLVNEIKDFRSEIFNSIKNEQKDDLKILDIGCSSRKFSPFLKEIAEEYITADINKFDGIDMVFDLCDSSTIPNNLYGKFNHIIALAIFEHLWQPFYAAENLVKLLDKNKKSKLWLYAPFLLRYHAPKTLEFQDYFRYTRDSWAILFPDAKTITISPVRGTLTTALNLAIPGYKSIFEEKFRGLGKFMKFADKFYSLNSNKYQVSGYNVVIDF